GLFLLAAPVGGTTKYCATSAGFFNQAFLSAPDHRLCLKLLLYTEFSTRVLQGPLHPGLSTLQSFNRGLERTSRPLNGPVPRERHPSPQPCARRHIQTGWADLFLTRNLVNPLVPGNPLKEVRYETP